MLQVSTCSLYQLPKAEFRVSYQEFLACFHNLYLCRYAKLFTLDPNLSKELIVTDLNNAAAVDVVPEQKTFLPSSMASSLAVVVFPAPGTP